MNDSRSSKSVTAIVLLLAVMCFAQRGWAQEAVIAETFSYPSGSGNQDMSKMSALTQKGWAFEGQCFAIAGGNMQLGSGSDPQMNHGAAITPELGRSGNFTVLINTSVISDNPGKFKVSVIGDGEISSSNSEYDVANGGKDFHPSAIMIKGGTPSTKVKIEGTYGKFYVKSVDIYAIGESIFYESFNFMKGGASEFEVSTTSPAASPAYCDNTNAKIKGNVNQINHAIYVADTDYSYQMPAVPDVKEGKRYILTFKAAEFNSNYYPIIGVSITGGGQLGPLNSQDLSDMSSKREVTLTDNVYQTWSEHQLVITGMTPTSTISFYGKNLYIDNILLSPVPTVTLSQDADNTLAIGNNLGLRNVQLKRTLAASCWAPLCLPFNVDYAMMATATGQEVELATLASAEGGVFRFDNVSPGSTVDAGTPFLARVQQKVENPTFCEVLMTDASNKTVDFGNYKLAGIYNPTDMKTDGTQLFLGTDGKLYKPREGGNHLGGLRAYFEIPANGNARLATPDGEQSGMAEADREDVTTTVVDLLGRKRTGCHSLLLSIDPRTGRKTIVKQNNQ